MDRQEIDGIINRYAEGGVVKMAAGGTPPTNPLGSINPYKGFWITRYNDPKWQNDRELKAVKAVIEGVGGMAKARSLYNKYQSDLKAYNIQQYKDSLAAQESAYQQNPDIGAAARLAEEFKRAVEYFDQNEPSSKSTYETLATRYTNEAARLEKEEADKQAAAVKAQEEAAARSQAAVDKRKELQDAATARRDAELARSKTERDTAYDAIDEQYNAARETLLAKLANKEITGEQFQDANTDLGAAKKLARYTVEENYKAITNGANTQFKSDMDFAGTSYTNIKSGKTATTAKLALPKYTPPTTKAVAFTPSDQSKEILQAYEEANPREEKVKDTRTAAEIIEEMRANAPTIGVIDRTPLPGSKEFREMTQAPDYVGPSGLTRAQANDLAQQFLVYGNFQFVNEKGVPTLNQVGQLSDEILNEGWNATFNRINPYANYTPFSPSHIDRSVAEQFARDLAIRGGYTIDEGTVTGWANTIQRVGFDEGAKRYVEKNPGVSGSPLPNAQDITNYINANNTALSGLKENARTTLNENVAKILDGEDLSFGSTSVTKQEYLDFILGGTPVEDLTPQQKENLQFWDDVFQTLGSEAAIGRWNATQQSNKMSFAEPQQPFQPDITGEGTTTPGTAFEPDIYGGGAAPTPPGTTPTTTPPTTTTGAPGFAFSPGEISGYTPTTMQPSEEPPLFGEETTFQPAPYTPPPLLTAPPPSPTLSPAQQVIGAPAIERPVGAPMQPLTPEQAGAQFVQPTQEDYFAYFGYTPEQLNAAQFLAELEGAPRAGVAAQTVPVLPPAVPGATAPTGMREGGSVSGLKAAAQELQAQGRGGDTILAHINPQEAAMLKAMGGSGTINPKTGLREFLFGRGGIDINIGKKSQKILVPVAAALAAPYLPAIAGSTAVTAGILAGAGTMLGGGSLQQGLQTGLMAGLSASAAQGMGYEGVPGVDVPGQVAGTGGSAMGAGVSLTPSPGDLDYIAAADKSLLGKATDYLANIPSAVGESVSNMDWKDATMLGYLGLGAAGLKENQNAQKEYEQYMAGLAQEDERKRRLGQETFAQTLGAVPVKSGGLIALAGGGMTYAEGGGTTGPTNEPRMVKGTGDGMSDSVPATIEGVQEARLANDEFVIPADVVADLGNGSSSAGAQQLYDMMDRVRQARHGTTEQPPEINARKMMPA
jgi:hypothetical protein